MLQEKLLTNNVFEVSQVFVSMVSKTQLNFVKLSPHVNSKNVVPDIKLFLVADSSYIVSYAILYPKVLGYLICRCSIPVLCIYRVSQEECTRLLEGVPYVKVYRYNPKHLCPKLNGYGDNAQRKVWSSGGSTHCTCQLTSLIDVCPWVRCPMTESPFTLTYSGLIPECAVSHVTSVLAFMCHV